MKRVALALVLLALGVLAALLAADVQSRENAVRAGDLRFEADPAAASWNASTVLPFDVLGLGPQLEFRRAAQGFAAALAAGNGYDNGVSELQARGEVEAELTDVARGGDAKLAAAADNLAGILAYSDSRQTGANAPAPVERSVADFQDAIRRDPGADDAKFNLEWLLTQLRARGTRPGANAAGHGSAPGRRGAGAGLPGRGY